MGNTLTAGRFPLRGTARRFFALPAHGDVSSAHARPSKFPNLERPRRTRLDAVLQAVKNVRAALDDFYNSLSDERKAQFNMIGRQQTARR
jgi:hypothetical protein